MSFFFFFWDKGQLIAYDVWFLFILVLRCERGGFYGMLAMLCFLTWNSTYLLIVDCFSGMKCCFLERGMD